MKNLLSASFLAILLCASVSSSAQLTIVKDINAGNVQPSSSSFPQLFIESGNHLFFTASTPEAGTELWKTDGTETGTVMVKDLTPNGNSTLTNLTDVNGVLYFISEPAINKRALWKSDGTEAGTVLVKDFGEVNSTISNLVSFNGTLFFLYSGALWKSDGTSGGTVAVKDNFSDTGISYLTVAGGKLFFAASSTEGGKELWKSDGTNAGTVMVKDILPGNASSSPGNLSNVNGVLFFSAYTPTTGRELWKSDGTEAGTVFVKDISPGTGSGYNVAESREIFSINGTAYFSANDGINGNELWKSDGTEAGTMLVLNISSGSSSSSPYGFTGANGIVYFLGSNSRLYRSDGTAAGTQQIKSSNNESAKSSALVNINGTIFFEAYTSDVGMALWKTDGTNAGTVMVKDISSQRNDDYFTSISSPINFKDNLLFSGYDDLHGWELWKSDGTTAGTNILKEINTQGSAEIDYLTAKDGIVYFRANNGVHGGELWKSDGTEAGTVLVKDINPSLGSSNPFGSILVGNTIFFAANDGVHGHELWKTDGTEAGTVMVKDCVPGSGSLFVNFPFFKSAGGLVYFLSTENGGTGEIWRSDGTEAGTYPVTSIPGVYDGTSFEIIGNTIFFAGNGPEGTELWKSDGTVAGSVIVKDINPGNSAGSSPARFINVNGTLFFSANDGVNGQELWKSDGTEAGTVMVKNINPAFDGLRSFEERTAYVLNNVLYFTATDGAKGTELWKTDGTEAGTVLVKDVYNGETDSSPSQFTEFDGQLYFLTRPYGGWQQLWKSDGTTDGTKKVIDLESAEITPRYQSSAIVLVGEVMYIVSIDNNLRNSVLWKLDKNNICKAISMNDLLTYSPTASGNKLFFRGYSNRFGGYELFVHDIAKNTGCKVQTIEFDALPADKRMKDAPFTLNASASSGLPVTFTSSNTAVATVSGNTVTITGVGETDLTASQPGDDTWAPATPVTQKLKVDVPVGIGETELNNTITYPNPFSERFHLRIEGASEHQADVSVLTTTGSRVEYLPSLQTNTDHVLGSQWPSGLYILKIKTGNGLLTRKIVKK